MLRLLRRQAMYCRWMFASENSDSPFVFTGHHPPGRTATAYNALFLSSLFWLPSLRPGAPSPPAAVAPRGGQAILGRPGDGLEVPRVVRIRRERSTGPVVVGLHTGPPTSPAKDNPQAAGPPTTDPVLAGTVA